MTDIKYEPTRDHWTPYEPWMRDVLADDARTSRIDGGEEIRMKWERRLTLGRPLEGVKVHPDDVPERPTGDIALRAHRAATRHLQNLTEARWAEEDGTDVDWAELGTTAPYDGCDDCIVREVATIVITELEAAGAIRVLDPDTERGEQA